MLRADPAKVKKRVALRGSAIPDNFFPPPLEIGKDPHEFLLNVVCAVSKSEVSLCLVQPHFKLRLRHLRHNGLNLMRPILVLGVDADGSSLRINFLYIKYFHIVRFKQAHEWA